MQTRELSENIGFSRARAEHQDSSYFRNGHGFIGYPKGRNVKRALGFSLTGTVSTSPNLAKARARRASNVVALRAPSLAKFGEVDTIPVSEKPSALSTFRPLGYPIKP